MTHGNFSVKGELYEVDNPTRSRLDMLEGHPTFYKREIISVEEHGEAWAYIIVNKESGRVVGESGDGTKNWP